MGCVSGKANQNPLPKGNDQTVNKAPSVPPQTQNNAINQHPNPPADKSSSVHQESSLKNQPQNVPQEEHNSHIAASGIKNSLNVANPDPHHSAIIQSSIQKSIHDAEVPVIEQREGLAHASPVKPPSNVVAGEAESFVGSGISNTQQETRDAYKRERSNLEHIVEQQEEKVHDEGVNNFAIPIKNINLHVEVR